MAGHSSPQIEVLNTGSELLLGTTLNTHGAWIGQELQPLGLRVSQQTTVPDGDGGPITEAIEGALRRKADALIITGGLGPTSDDLTREATVEALGLELILDEHALRTIEAYFALRGREMVDSNKKQAEAPVGADILPNPNGTAPGLYLPPRLGKGCALFLLPGPPRELKPLFKTEVLPRLVSLFGIEKPPALVELKFTGVGESDFQQILDAKLQELVVSDGLEFGYCAHIAELDLRLIGTEAVLQKARALVNEHFADKLINDDQSSLEATVVRLALEKGKKIATAESCTGGLIASRLTDVSGSSGAFTHGFVTYANEAKVEMLGVDEDLLDSAGAVSGEVAEQMAEGALAKSGADLAVAVTGIAGPTGGSEEKPVGTCYLALAQKGQATEVIRAFHPSGRETFKRSVSQRALDLLRRALR